MKKLPTHATCGDIEAVCKFLLDKPDGASTRDTVAAFDKRTTGEKKLSACKQLGFIKSEGLGKVKITRRGCHVILNAGEHKKRSFLGAISDLPAYKAVIEKAVSREHFSVTTSEIVTFWLEQFPSEVINTASGRSSQSICLFRMMEGAGLGAMTLGTIGRPTRFDFNPDTSREFVEKGSQEPTEAQGGVPKEPETTAAAMSTTLREMEERESVHEDSRGGKPQGKPTTEASAESVVPVEVERPQRAVSGAGGIFITSSGNEYILGQIKELVAFGKLEAVVEQLHELSASTMDVMRSCQAAVIHASADKPLRDVDGKEVRLMNENALIQLGAANAFFGRNIILLVEDGVELPAALPELRECRYSGRELDGASMMTLVKALKDF